MPNTDPRGPLVAARDLLEALVLLTRLPLPRMRQPRGHAAAWAYPAAGLAVGVIAAALAQCALWLGLPAAPTAALALASLVICTGGLHEDGLADTADGLWGGWDSARRLEIMKDSRTGAYGVLAIGLSLLLRWSLLTALIEANALWVAVPLGATWSRAAMPLLMTGLPNARTAGLSQSVGRPTQTTALLGLLWPAIATLILAPAALIPLALVCAAAAFTCAFIAKSKISGQTGDIIGATQQITEIAALMTLAAIF